MSAKPVSLQLYSLREAAAKDFPAVIRAVGEIGYAGVETAGFHGLKPKEVRKLVEDQGMVVSSFHGPWAKPDNLQEVIDTAGELGVDLACTGFRGEDFKNLDAIRATAEKVNLMHDRLRAAGLALFLHNHWWEFETIDSRLKYDVFAELAPRVTFELDVYWAANFGAVDPAAVLRRYARRTPLLHLKDGPLVKGEPMQALGSGKMRLREVLREADPSVLQWVVVELDACATDMLQAVRESYDWLVGNGLASGRRKPAR
jgi:sugar phosphate isomerase/epimerase